MERLGGWEGRVLEEDERAEDEDEDEVVSESEDDEDEEAEEEDEEDVESSESEAEEEEDEEPEVVSDVDVEVQVVRVVVEGLITRGGTAKGSYKCPYCTTESANEVESSSLEALSLSSLLESSDSDAEELVVELL